MTPLSQNVPIVEKYNMDLLTAGVLVRPTLHASFDKMLKRSLCLHT